MSLPSDAAPVTVLTGAAGGIGRALSAGLLAAGHHVIAVVHDEASFGVLPQATKVTRLVPVSGDLTTAVGRAKVVEAARREFGAVTALVNNAGVGMGSIRRDYYIRPVRPDEIDSETIARFLAINAHAPIALALELLPLFTRGWGRIVNVGTSLTAMLRPGFLPYAMSKAALESASAVLAKDLEGCGIAVCVFNPGGPVDTPMARREEPELRARLISPESLVAPLCWATSQAASGINGVRLTATHWDAADPTKSMAPIGWPQLSNDSSWAPDRPALGGN